jgi:DNA-binding CsgD family transcriptional regulator
MSAEPEKKSARIVWPDSWGKIDLPDNAEQAGPLYASEVRAAPNFADLARKSRAFLVSQGVSMGTYHHIPPFGAEDVFPVAVPGSQFGFPRDYAEDYVRNRSWEGDPAVRLVQKRTQPFLWTDISRQNDLSKSEKEIVGAAVKAGLQDGYCFPLFGPGGHNGYAALGTFPVGESWNEGKLTLLFWAVQISHLRVCELIAEMMPQPIDLSARELEVLNWIARGKSNSVIAELIGISTNTVDTYMRRLFEKLGVTDRTSAAIKGLVLGLLK